MSDPGSIWISLLILIILTLCNAFFAMSEIAILSSNQNKMRHLAEDGDKRAAKLLRLTSLTSDFLATIQVGVTLSGLLSSAVAADKFAGVLAEALSFLPVGKGVISGVSLVLITVVLAYCNLIFGELVPKRLAMRYPDRIALAVAGTVSGVYTATRPFVKLLAASTNLVARLLGVKEKGEAEESVTQEDILMMVEQGEETGTVDENELQMIQNIFDLDDKTVDEVMTHRTEMVMAPLTDTVGDVILLAQQEGYSRIPVYDEGIDDIVGIIYIKDLIGQEDKTASVSAFVRKALYVPEGKLCSKLLLQFQETKIHMAIVIDEYGGTAGLVTLEDVLEIIVGSIQDESDHETLEIERQEDGSWLCDGSVSLEELEKQLETEITDEYDCDTLAGYLLAVLESIPETLPEEPIRLNRRFIGYILELDDRRISRVRLVEDPLPEEPEDD